MIAVQPSGVPYLKMESVISYRKSVREKKGKTERTGWGMSINDK